MAHHGAGARPTAARHRGRGAGSARLRDGGVADHGVHCGRCAAARGGTRPHWPPGSAADTTHDGAAASTTTTTTTTIRDGATTTAATTVDDVAVPRGTRLGSDDPLAALPTGSPPRAGVLTESGDVVVWRDGEPVVLASLPGYAWRQAVETAHGILVTDWSERTVLIRPDGRVDALDPRLTGRPAVDERGRLLAAKESVHGRNARQSVHLVNLSDLSRQTMPGDDHWGHVVALHGGAVYLRGVGATPAKRWSPGGDPEPLPHNLNQIDPLTGTWRVLTFDGVLLVRPDGSTHMVPVDDSAALVPGATQLYTLRNGPPAITLFDVTAQSADPRIRWLPVYVSTRSDLGVGPVWEDLDRVLLMAGSRFPPGFRPGGGIIRVNIRTGAVERVPLPAGRGRIMPVVPLLTSDRASADSP